MRGDVPLWGSLVSCGRLSIGPLPRLLPAYGGNQPPRRLTTGPTWRRPCRTSVGRAIMPAAAFQAARSCYERTLVHAKRRLKAGGSQDWLPHKAAEPQPNVIRRPKRRQGCRRCGLGSPLHEGRRIFACCEEFEEV